MGLLCGLILMPAILYVRDRAQIPILAERINQLNSPTRRKKIVVWVLRVVALVLVILAFILTIKNFCKFGMVLVGLVDTPLTRRS
jgi:hypothetical protein